MVRPSSGNGPRWSWWSIALFLAVIHGLLGVGAVASCNRSGPPPHLSGPELHALRNRGKLQAARETPEGYAEAAKAFLEVVRRADAAGGAGAGDLLNAARCLIFADRAEEAAKLLERARDQTAKTAEADAARLYLEGLAARRAGRPAEAAERFRVVAERRPDLAAAWYQLAVAHSQARDYARAVPAFEKVLELDPGRLAALYKLSTAHRMLGEERKAEESLASFQRAKEASGAGPAAPGEADDERCRYTEVTLVPPDPAAAEPPPLALRFEEATAPAGLAGAEAAAPVWFDHDRDGDPDLYLVRRGPNRLLRNDGGRFTDRTQFSDADDPGQGLDARPADFNNDSITDLLVVNESGPGAILKGLGEGVFQPLAGEGAPRDASAALWADHDHDGDLDVVSLEGAAGPAAGEGGRGLRLVVRRNNGDETFTLEDDRFPGPVAAPLSGRPAPGAAVMVDLDRENDIDFVVAAGAGPALAFLNLRRGPFRRVELPDLAGSTLLAAGDLNGDGELDLVGAPGPLVVLSTGPRGAGQLPLFRRLRSPTGEAPVEKKPAEQEPAAAGQLTLLDLDQDGDLDLLMAGAGGLVFFANRRGGELERAPLPGILPEAAASARRFAAADVDGDGRLDLALAAAAGSLTLWRGAGEPFYRAVTLKPAGGRDNRGGIGAHASLFAGGRYQRRLVEACGAAGGTGGARFGLGSATPEALDGFEILWPNGIVQAVLPEELRWDFRLALEVTQKRGLAVSCPFLFADDGSGYRFLTDVVGVAPLDEWLPAGAEPRLDPEEYVRIPGASLRPRSGRLRLAITEELRETTYLDRAALIGVTHPAGTVVHCDESTRQGGIEPLTVWIVRQRDMAPPRAARDAAGRDVLASVAGPDGVYLHPYGQAPPQWAGWVPPHHLDLEPPRGLSGPGALLLLAGRIYWPDSSVLFSLAQHGRSWSPLRLEGLGRRDAAGSRSEILCADLGFPCGMDRTVVAPLGELAGGDLERFGAVRLAAGYRFLWDAFRFARSSARVDLAADGEAAAALDGETLRLTRSTLELATADLGYHGYSETRGDFELHEQTYDFARAAPGLKFPSPTGRATRYGDVRPLLLAPDDHLVVMAPGDAVRLEFAAPGPAAGEDGGERATETTYFLLLTGWAKENNFHNRTGRRFEPLPFHAMRCYPPSPEEAGSRSREPAYARYLGDYQTRLVTEERNR